MWLFICDTTSRKGCTATGVTIGDLTKKAEIVFDFDILIVGFLIAGGKVAVLFG